MQEASSPSRRPFGDVRHQPVRDRGSRRSARPEAPARGSDRGRTRRPQRADRLDDRSALGERTALEWVHAIVWDSDAANDELWERLHSLLSEPELVELACAIGFELGQQHWRRTIGLPARDAYQFK